MARLPILRSDEKLHQGFFYVQVGHRFYGGEMVETVEVEVDRPRPFTHTDYWEGWARGARAARDRRKGTLANYQRSNHEKRKGIFREAHTESRPTGKRTPRLVDDLAQAKKYRRRDLVESTCERLRTCYAGLDVKVTVEYQQGEAS